MADEFLTWPACAPGARWLDIGCGSGALTARVAARSRPRTLLGVERSAGFAAAARAHGSPPALFARADAQALPVGDAAVDVAVSGLVLNFLPEPGAAVAEAARVVAAGGLVAAYVWDYAEGMGFVRPFWDAVTTVALSSAAELDEGRRFPMCRPAPLRRLWSETALVEVEVVPMEVPTRFAGFADLWDPFLAGRAPPPVTSPRSHRPPRSGCGKPCASGCRPARTARSRSGRALGACRAVGQGSSTAGTRPGMPVRAAQLSDPARRGPAQPW